MRDALSYALKLLGIRDYFKEELRAKVAQKYGALDAENAINTVCEYGYINDERVAENYISARLRSGYGPYYIRAKLFNHGYNVEISDIMAVAEKEEIDLEEQVKKLAARRIVEPKDNDPYKAWVKCMNFLQNRGYPDSICCKVIKQEDFER